MRQTQTQMNGARQQVAPVDVVGGLRPYSPGRPAGGIDLFLDSNEGPAVPPQLASILAKVDAGGLRQYPSPARLEARIADLLGLDPASVLVTAGADDALERAIRAVCGPGRDAVLTTPSFEMLGRYVRLTGASVREVEWWQGEYPLDEVLDMASDCTALVAVVSPNNPTGAVISRGSLETLARRLPGALVLLDHAYVELADEDLTSQALEHPNILVFRTFSKAWGAAGLRVGYVAGDPEVVAWLRSIGQPYSVSALSLALVEGLLRERQQPRADVITAIREQRTRLSRHLVALGLQPLPSQANFVLAQTPDADRVRRGLASLGIAVRGFEGHPLLGEHLRITVPGEPEAFTRLEAGLETCLAPEAVLLDMDGVLADVSRSYRLAIASTARTWGVELAPAEIAAAKTEPGSNNDWVVTQRLMARHGIDIPLEQVTRRFEELYQGPEGGEPGLRESEALLIDRCALERLGRRYRLAVVTGRPRRDAARFLERFGIHDCFEVIVAMEDAPPKPDPAPVRVALERLGARTAWMIGDSPDDIRAARAARVLPVGVVAPGDDPTEAAAALRSAGAAEVLDTIDQMAEVLP